MPKLKKQFNCDQIARDCYKISQLLISLYLGASTGFGYTCSVYTGLETNTLRFINLVEYFNSLLSDSTYTSTTELPLAAIIIFAGTSLFIGYESSRQFSEKYWHATLSSSCDKFRELNKAKTPLLKADDDSIWPTIKKAWAWFDYITLDIVASLFTAFERSTVNGAAFALLTADVCINLANYIFKRFPNSENNYSPLIEIITTSSIAGVFGIFGLFATAALTVSWLLKHGRFIFKLETPSDVHDAYKDGNFFRISKFVNANIKSLVTGFSTGMQLQKFLGIDSVSILMGVNSYASCLLAAVCWQLEKKVGDDVSEQESASTEDKDESNKIAPLSTGRKFLIFSASAIAAGSSAAAFRNLCDANISWYCKNHATTDTVFSYLAVFACFFLLMVMGVEYTKMGLTVLRSNIFMPTPLANETSQIEIMGNNKTLVT